MKTAKFLFTCTCVAIISCGSVVQEQQTTNWPDCNGENCRILSAMVESTVGLCAKDMVRVKGKYCTQVKQECEVWMDPQGSNNARCQKYKPSECIGPKVDKDFCIDQDEYTKAGESLPEVNITWNQATITCLDQGKRLCNDDEWIFACEGEEMRPYSTGLERNSVDCNYDETRLGKVGHLIDYRKPSASLDKCVSPFGVRNMNGNVDEWTRKKITPSKYPSILKGGWWGPVRNRCRPATTAHGPLYSDAQVGFRCCSNTQ
jgi:sulfatase modifying factor 1